MLAKANLTSLLNFKDMIMCYSTEPLGVPYAAPQFLKYTIIICGNKRPHVSEFDCAHMLQTSSVDSKG